MLEAFNFNRFKKEETQEAEAANDNEKAVAPEFDISEQAEAINVLKRTLSDRAWSLFEGLYEVVDDPAAFEERIRDLNALVKEEQLNYANPKTKEELQNETLESRLMETTIPIAHKGVMRLLKIERFKNGTYTFSAA